MEHMEGYVNLAGAAKIGTLCKHWNPMKIAGANEQKLLYSQ